MKRKYWWFLAFFLLFSGCVLEKSEVNQYIAIKEDTDLVPIAKIKYKILVENQEIVYWIEEPGKGRSTLFKLNNCLVADNKNWQGDMVDNYHSLLPRKVEFRDGNFVNPNSINWWIWHFQTNPKPSNLSAYISYVFCILISIGVIIAVKSIISAIIRIANNLKNKIFAK